MRDQNGNSIDLPMPMDPLLYIGRVHRGEDGRVATIEVFYDDSVIHLEDGDEFVTFRTEILLEQP